MGSIHNITNYISLLADSAHNLIIAAWNVLVTTIGAFLAVHLLGSLAHYLIKRWQIFPVHVLFVVTSPTNAQPPSQQVPASSSFNHVDVSPPSDKGSGGCASFLSGKTFDASSNQMPSDTSPSLKYDGSSPRCDGSSLRPRVRFAPTVQVSSGNSSVASVSSDIQLMDVSFVESKV